MPTDIAIQRDKRYINPIEPLHIVGREWCFEWYQGEVDRVIKLWDGGYSLQIIAAKVNSDCWSVLMLLKDLSDNGKIGKRIGYVWGVR